MAGFECPLRIVAFPVFERKVLHTELPFPVLAVIYVAGSCALGIFFAHLIEFPVLRFRDRFFPVLSASINRSPASLEKIPATIKVG